jgi:hypothetical protein
MQLIDSTLGFDWTGSVTGLGSVSGPAEVRIRDEIVDRARLEINVLPLRQSAGKHLFN